ncbi:MAG: hypothetical protein RLZZ356_32, partial [Verrucomicrobiota bacterium]
MSSPHQPSDTASTAEFIRALKTSAGTARAGDQTIGQFLDQLG